METKQLKDIVKEKVAALDWSESEAERLASAISGVWELSTVAKREGILFLDDTVATLPDSTPIKDILLDIVKNYINGRDFDEYISKNIDSLPEGVDAAVCYAYIYGGMDLEMLDESIHINEVLSIISDDKRGAVKEILESTNDKYKKDKNEQYIECFLNTVTYADDSVLESYIRATCKEIAELTDRDFLYLYVKASDKFIQFAKCADNEYRKRIYRLVKNDEMQATALKYGEIYTSVCDAEGKVKISATHNISYLVMDVHEIVFNAYSAGELESGSDIILNPDVEERDMKEQLRSMGK